MTRRRSAIGGSGLGWYRTGEEDAREGRNQKENVAYVGGGGNNPESWSSEEKSGSGEPK